MNLRDVQSSIATSCWCYFISSLCIQMVDLVTHLDYQMPWLKEFYCPTGTGKSVTGAHLAYALIISNPNSTRIPSPDEKIRCVMYCGPSNKSVDVVLGENIFYLPTWWCITAIQPIYIDKTSLACMPLQEYACICLYYTLLWVGYPPEAKAEVWITKISYGVV